MPPDYADAEPHTAVVQVMLTEDQIRTIVQQEIEASGVISSFKPLLEMTPDQAIAIGTAIALLWATAWCIKQVANFIKEKDDEDSW